MAKIVNSVTIVASTMANNGQISEASTVRN